MKKVKQKVALTPKLLIGVIVVAAVLRIIYLVELSSTPFFRHPVLDAQYYLAWAGRLAWGGFHSGHEYQGNPLYPYLLAFLIRFAHAGPILIRIIQHGLGIVTCFLVFRSGRAIFNEKIGLLAAFLYAIYIPALFYEGWLLSASLTSFLIIALLTSLLSARQSRRPIHWTGSGIIGGLLTLARPTLLPAGVLLWLLFGFRKRQGGRWQRALLFLAGLLIIIIPTSLYFSLCRHELVYISPHGGENFYIGNNPRATGVSRLPEFARPSPGRQHEDFRREASTLTGRELSACEASAFWFRRGIGFILSHPLHFIKLLFFKVFLFFSGTDFADNYHLPFFRAEIGVLKIPFTWHLLSTLALLGMAVAWREKKRPFLLYLLIASYVLSIALFFVTSRFRIPLAPLLCLPAAYFIWFIRETVRKKRWLETGFFVSLGVIIFFSLGWKRLTGPGTPLDSFHLASGEVHFRDGDFETSLSHLRLAREGAKKRAAGGGHHLNRLRFALGQTYLALEEEEAADTVFRDILKEGSSRAAELNFEIGNSYAVHGNYGRAREYFEKALWIDPGYFRAWNNLGLSFKAEGALQEAGDAFRKALAIKDRYAAAHANLGNLYLQEERFEEALEEFRTALEIDPGLARHHLATAFCLRKLGRLTEAEAEAARCPGALRGHP